MRTYLQETTERSCQLLLLLCVDLTNQRPTGKMEEACLALEREFKRVVMDLEYTSTTLESEFEAR
jgi:hypothetical protein